MKRTQVSQYKNLPYFILLGIFSFLIFYYGHYVKLGLYDFISTLNDMVIHTDNNKKIITWTIISYWSLFGIIIVLYIFRILQTKNLIYTFTTERLVFYYGILNKKKDYIEYFRIRDYYINRSLWMRIFGIAEFVIISTDRRLPLMKIKGLKGLYDYENELRYHIEESRVSGKGRELDIVH